ncbi:ArpU family phage packaging/lysis transcriptional regulator [Pseudogracilibacillus auburnensis]|uniref:ArpU family phage packaging/lysis transcriptional regulator n=1 Tax=Pseudogracilibacillus auburnensis TaxID=1494959 RepID=UPI001F61253A|nr:ArpU family phage packaging/lysis transcriptional regulator [Pseudogracilibacillus auburnensis]
MTAIAVVWCPFYFFKERMMIMQLTFLPEIDRDKTKKNVEAALEKYQIMLLMDPEECEPKITASFRLAPSSPTNEFHSTTEDVALERIEITEKRRNYINRIRKAVNRLNYQERTIIIKRYINDDDIYDYEVYNEMGFSERKYYRIKARAFYKLAFILRLEVYKEEKNNELCTANSRC